MTTRQEKVNSLLQRLISEHLLIGRPEELTGLLTIKTVEVTADLEHAKVFFSVVGQDPDEVLRLLERQRHEIQKVMGQKLVMKKIPRLHFLYDASEEYVQHINKLIQKTRDE